jgi:predicted DNA-binding antitoxin AbrB/MazE fold protein
MSQTIDAIYQNGIFRPLTPLDDDIAEGRRVRLHVEAELEPQPEINPIMTLAENFYDGLSEDDIQQIEKIALDRSNFFGDRKL